MGPHRWGRHAGWLGVVALALIPRFGIIVASGFDGRSPEPFEYEVLARNLLAGRGYLYTHLGADYVSFHSSIPYVLLTALVYVVTNGAQTAMLLVQSLTSALLALVMNALGRRLVGPAVGGLAGALVALHPGLVYYDTRKLHPLSLDALLIAGATLAIYHLVTSSSARSGCVAGLLGGLALLERGSYILMMGAILLWVLWRGRARRTALTRSAAFVLGAALMVGPWLGRNILLHGTPVVMTTTGEHLWRGNNPKATGSSLNLDGTPLIESVDTEFREKLRSLDEMGQMRLFGETATRYIMEHPGTFVHNVARRLLYFAWFSPTTGILYPPSYLRIYQVYYSLTLLIATWGMLGLFTRWRAGDASSGLALTLLAGVWLSVGLTQSIFYVELRHRWGVEPLMLLLAATGAVNLVGSGSSRAS